MALRKKPMMRVFVDERIPEFLTQQRPHISRSPQASASDGALDYAINAKSTGSLQQAENPSPLRRATDRPTLRQPKQPLTMPVLAKMLLILLGINLVLYIGFRQPVATPAALLVRMDAPSSRIPHIISPLEERVVTYSNPEHPHGTASTN